MSATVCGEVLLDLGYTVDQVVHAYGDLCQAIADLAIEREVLFGVDEFRTLSRCLEQAIADTVEQLNFQREAQLSARQIAAEKLRLGFLVHELRNALGTASLAVRALEETNLPIGGSTGAILKRSLSTLGLLIGRASDEVQGTEQRQLLSMATFIADAQVAAGLDAGITSAILEVESVDPLLGVLANSELLHAALANLLQNAFKFTKERSVVALNAYACGEQVHIDVEDHCGGLSPDGVGKMFIPFHPNGHSRAGLGLGLSIARRSVEADHWTLTVRNVPDSGCIFTISLPRHALQ